MAIRITTLTAWLGRLGRQLIANPGWLAGGSALSDPGGLLAAEEEKRRTATAHGPKAQR